MRCQFLGLDLKKTDSFYFLFLGVLILRTQSPCCKEAQAVLWRGPCETNSQHQLRVGQLGVGPVVPADIVQSRDKIYPSPETRYTCQTLPKPQNHEQTKCLCFKPLSLGVSSNAATDNFP